MSNVGNKFNVMKPGLDASGLVAPSIRRPCLTISRPSHTIGTTGPDDI